MFSKPEILIIIIIILLTFYFVISLSAKGSKDTYAAIQIKKYLFGVRILISIIAIVSLILWLFL